MRPLLAAAVLLLAPLAHAQVTSANGPATTMPASSISAGALGAGVTLPAGQLTNGPAAASLLPSTVAYTSVANNFTVAPTFSAGLTAAAVVNSGPAISTVTSCGAVTSFTGYAASGQVTVGSSPSTTCSITWSPAAPHGSACSWFETTRATLSANQVQSGAASSTATFSGSLTAGDVLAFQCSAW